MNNQAFTFESIGFASTRALLDRLPSEDLALAHAKRLFAGMAIQFASLGFTALQSASVSEDDEQGNEYVKCFIGVTLIGCSKLSETEPVPDGLAMLLDGVSSALCNATAASGASWPVDYVFPGDDDSAGACDSELVREEDWELSSIDDVEVEMV